MQFLAIERDLPGIGTELTQPRLRAEALAAWKLLAEDVLRHIWFTTDHRAVLLLECADEASARDALASLPLYREGLIDFELTALRPYDGFARLFGPEEPFG